MKNIILKLVQIQDYKKVLNFEQSVVGKFFVGYDEEDEVKDYIKNNKVFFIMFDGKEVGTILYKEKEDNCLEINGLIVSEKYRGKGIGTLAMTKLLENIDKNKKIDLVVHPKNSAAIIIYLKIGFVIEGFRKNYFGDGEDRLYLVKK